LRSIVFIIKTEGYKRNRCLPR